MAPRPLPQHGVEQLFYGRKHWYLFPPATNLMGKKQVLDWLEHDVTGLIEQGFQPMECVQLQGDVLIVPELWGHAVLNVQESVAVASEVRGSSYRLELPRVYRDLAGGGGGGGGRGRPPRGRPPKGYRRAAARRRRTRRRIGTGTGNNQWGEE